MPKKKSTPTPVSGDLFEEVTTAPPLPEDTSKEGKPAWCWNSGCPLASIGKGFALGSGDPETARIAICAETPASDEISFPVGDADEISRRARHYPKIPLRQIQLGAPLVGRTGTAVNQWFLPKAGLKREELYLDNSLRCFPEMNKEGSHYPTGDVRAKAEACCRHYDRWNLFKPDIAIMATHPAALFHEMTPFPFILKAFQKARDFAAEGHKVVICVGGKAASLMLGIGENITRWQGSYQWLSDAPERSVEVLQRHPSTVTAYHALRENARVFREVSSLDLLQGNVRGLDLEWDIESRRIHTLGLADTRFGVSIPYLGAGREHLASLVSATGDRRVTWVGHNIISADIQELRRDGIDIPVNADYIEDTIIRFWLTNSHLTKSSKKASAGDESEEEKGRGFMALWYMLSLYTDWWNYKECREPREGKVDGVPVFSQDCQGPCPEHDPLGYNGLDALGPVLALPGLKKHCKIRGVEHLYKMHVEVADILARMGAIGVKVDLPYVARLREEFLTAKKEIKDVLPFNPNSGQQVMKWFKGIGVVLENNQEQTIRDALDDNPTCLSLQQLLDYKEIGDGPDRWFGEKWLKDGDELHARFGFYTSHGRLMCSSPNLQNVAKRRVDRKTGEKIGTKMRRAVIARDGYFLYRADYKGAENRTYLAEAGYEKIPETDVHAWMAEVMDIKPTDPFALSLGSPRDAAKSVVFGTSYLEGLKLIPRGTLLSSAIRREIAAGVLLVFSDWSFNDKVVAFTGVNLAKRAFGSASWENRKKALGATQKFFAAFPRLRDLQKKILRQCELEKAVRQPHGYYLLSFDQDAERCKQAAAAWGAGPVAHIMKIALQRAWQDGRLNPRLTIHDEIVFEVDCRHDPKDVGKWITEAMCFATPELPTLILPVDISYSPVTKEQKTSNWADMVPIYQ